MQKLVATIVLVLIWCDVTNGFQLPHDLTFLGCLFRSPAFNETWSLFPETAVRTTVSKNVKKTIQYCKQIAMTEGDQVFGVYKNSCITGTKLHLILPLSLFESRKMSKCRNKIQIYSLVGQLYDDDTFSEKNAKKGKSSHPNPTRRSLDWVDDYVVDLEEIKRQYIYRYHTRIKDAPGDLFLNNDLEHDFHGNVLHWSCQGDEASYKPMYKHPYKPYSGRFSGLCTNRKRRTEGPGQFVGVMLYPGRIYKIQGWTRLLYARNLDELSAIELWVKWQASKSSPEQKRLLAKRDKYLDNHGWIFWNAQFHLPDQSSFRYIFIYFKGPKKHIDIFIDNMTLKQIPQHEDWKELSDMEIDKNRKRDVIIRVAFDKFKYSQDDLKRTKIEVRQISNAFGFGTSVYSDALKNNPKYKSFIQHNFEWATMENALKWDYMERVWGVSQHKETDELADTLINDMGMKVRGHCVYWALPENQPSWLIGESNASFQTSMKRRLYSVVGRYRNRFKQWDVNNEMLHGWFFTDRLNPGIRNWMFRAVSKLDPNARLFVNDFDVLAAPIFTQSYLEQIKSFQEQNLPIGGIGVQGHFTKMAHPEILRDRLDTLATAGLPIWITELDFKEEDAERRADLLETVMRVAFSHPAVEGIILWSFWNKHSWRGNYTSLFEGDNFLPNEAGKRYIKLREEWKTPRTVLHPSFVSDNECIFEFRTFHGKHAVKIIFPDGQIIEKKVDVENHPKALLLDFKAHVFNGP